MQSFFSFAGKDTTADVRLLNFQPIFSYQLAADDQFRSATARSCTTWRSRAGHRWLASLSYGQVVSFAGHKWRPTIEAGYDFKDDTGNPKWVLRAAVSLLLRSRADARRNALVAQVSLVENESEIQKLAFPVWRWPVCWQRRAPSPMTMCRRRNRASGSTRRTRSKPFRIACTSRHPPAHVVFADAGMVGNTLGRRGVPFAKGETVTSSTGIKARLARPLDFMVADHARTSASRRCSRRRTRG